MKSRKYQFNNSCLNIIFGDITNSTAEVIVSSDDTEISMGGGISGCIRNKGGEIIKIDAQRKLPAYIGDVVLSTAGALEHQKYIFHCLTLERKDSQRTLATSYSVQTYIIKHSIDKCFSLLHALNINSIAFPCIGTGSARIPLQRVAEVMADAISENLIKTQKEFNVELYLYDRYHQLQEIDYIDIFEHFAVHSALAKQKTGAILNDISTNTMVPTSISRCEEMNHQIFISYSRKDIDKVNVIKEILDNSSMIYWIDKEGIYSGENYKEVIVDAIDCAKVILFMSSINSNQSINVIRELGYAVKQKKSIIPIMLDDAQYAKSIRLDVSDIDQIDFTKDSLDTSKLISSLLYVLQIK